MAQNDDLSQADLSHLALKDMSAAQRAEIRRRFEDFIQKVAGSPMAAVKPKQKTIRKWVPGMKK
jgi:hypothetical protein